jgi:hypothetical protein
MNIEIGEKSIRNHFMAPMLEIEIDSIFSNALLKKIRRRKRTTKFYFYYAHANFDVSKSVCILK